VTKKDYELIAKAIRAGKEEHERFFGEGPHSQVLAFTGLLADAFAADNPRFDRRRFLEATGLWA
jgi:hypothetical protein